LEARKKAGAALSEPGRGAAEEPSERRSDERIHLVALAAILVASIAVRIAEARGTFLVPDEVLHARIALAPDLSSVYRLACEQAHPPLYFFLLHLWGRFATSDLALRLPSIFAAAGAVGLIYAWVRRKSTPLAALGAAALIALSPSVVALTLQARNYSLLLLLCSAALVAASPPDGRLTASRMAATAGFLVAACATHYSGILFAVPLLAFILVDLVLRRAPRRLLFAGVACSLAVGLFAGLLWWSRAHELRGGGLEAEVKQTWLRFAYWQPGEGFAGFTASAASGIHGYLLGHPVAGVFGLLLAVTTVAVLARKDPAFALLLASPFAVALGLSALRLYPFGPSRHSAWMLPTVAATIALPLSRLGTRAARLALPFLAIVAAAWSFAPDRYYLSAIPRSDRMQEQMEALVAAISQQIAPSDVVFVDDQTVTLLQRYTGGWDPSGPPRGRAKFRREKLGGLKVWASTTWVFDAPLFARELTELKGEAGIQDGQRVWIVQAGSRAELLPELRSFLSDAPISDAASFGGALWLFRISVP
jgi:4-amino-4-deoxy-L-arabinose transferase-like glycosyltransferase